MVVQSVREWGQRDGPEYGDILRPTYASVWSSYNAIFYCAWENKLLVRKKENIQKHNCIISNRFDLFSFDKFDQ